MALKTRTKELFTTKMGSPAFYSNDCIKHLNRTFYAQNLHANIRHNIFSIQNVQCVVNVFWIFTNIVKSETVQRVILWQRG